MLVINFLVIFSLTLLSQVARAAPDCDLVEDYFENIGSREKQGEYDAFRSRRWAHLNEETRNAVLALKDQDGAFVVDAGGGFSMAGLHIAMELGIPVININDIDPYERSVFIIADSSPEKLPLNVSEGIEYMHLTHYAGCEANAVSVFADFFGLELPHGVAIRSGSNSNSENWILLSRNRGLDWYRAEFRNFFGQIASKVRELGSERKFTNIEGLAEQVVPGIVGIPLLIDYFGPATVSPDPLGLLQVYYRSLANGGRAHVKFASYVRRVQRAGRRGRGLLEETLATLYPEVFSYHRPSRLLVMTRRENFDFDSEASRFRKESIEINGRKVWNYFLDG